jgi:hypothetical protein
MEPQTPARPLLVTVLTVLLTALVAGGSVYAVQSNSQGKDKAEWQTEVDKLTRQLRSAQQEAADARLTASTPSASAPSTTGAATSATPATDTANNLKKVSLTAYLYSVAVEVPETWSAYSAGSEAVILKTAPADTPAKAHLSLSKSTVQFGDTNWDQIDFTLYEGDRSDVVNLAKSKVGAGETLSQETVGGLPAQVITYPLDNGQVTKGGTGGKTYYLTVPARGNAGAYTVRINKQAKGDAAFEAAVTHLLQTIKFQ